MNVGSWFESDLGQKVTVKGVSAKTVGWPASQVGYPYDQVITANTSDGFRRIV